LLGSVSLLRLGKWDSAGGKELKQDKYTWKQMRLYLNRYCFAGNDFVFHKRIYWCFCRARPWRSMFSQRWLRVLDQTHRCGFCGDLAPPAKRSFALFCS